MAQSGGVKLLFFCQNKNAAAFGAAALADATQAEFTSLPA
jgi:hypothetical protein